MSLLAIVRPGAWDLPLFLHVLGAMVLVGAAVTGAWAALVRTPAGALHWARRLAFRTLLLAALPAFVFMRVGAEWIRSEEFTGAASDPPWVVLGYSAADGGGVLLIIGIVLAWLAAKRESPHLARIAAVVMAVAIVGWVVAAWAMAAKPG